MPPSSDQRTAATPRVCQWVNQADTLEHVVRYDGPTQSQQHIKLINTGDGAVGNPLPEFPPPNSPLRLERFFETLYRRYDERYVYSAPDLKSRTRRLEWSPDSPALESDVNTTLEYEAKLAGGQNET